MTSVDALIICNYSTCFTPATTGGIFMVQPNGMKPTHATYYWCDTHPGIGEKALETWPARQP